MSFGFGVGDFIAVGALIYKLCKDFKHAPEEFSAIGRELQSFHFVITDLTEQAKDPASCLNQHFERRKSKLSQLIENLVITMEELEDIFKRYQRMGGVSWSRVGMGQENLESIRSKLAIQISALSTFVGNLNMATLSRMEPMLQKIYQLMNEQAKKSADIAQSVLSVQRKDQDAENSWARLEMNLRAGGIPSAYIKGNREKIMELLGSVVQRNNLSQIDEEISPDDSASRVIRSELKIPSTKDGSQTSNPHNSTTSNKRASIFSVSQGSTKTGPKDNLSKRKLSYEEWLKTLSLEEKRLCSKLSNHGFNLGKMETALSSPLLKARIRVSKYVDLPRRALVWAVLNNERGALTLVLDRLGPLPPATYIDAIYTAIKMSDELMVEQLLKAGAKASARVELDGISRTLLALACGMYPSPQILHHLLEAGADVDAKDSDGWTPLHSAAWHSNQDEIQYLIHAGAKLESRNDKDETPIFCAQNSDIAEVLLKLGAVVGVKNSSQLTPLHLAAKKHDLGLVKVFLEFGADINAENSSGEAPLFYAIEPSIDKHGRLKKSGEVVISVLLEKGAQTDVGGRDGQSQLLFPVERTCEVVVKLLLNAGADANATCSAKSRETNTFPHFFFHDNHKMMKRLIDWEVADVDERRDSIFKKAVIAGNGAISKAFLAAGADVDATDHTGQTCLEAIFSKFGPLSPEKFTPVIKLLVRGGADTSRLGDMEVNRLRSLGLLMSKSKPERKRVPRPKSSGIAEAEIRKSRKSKREK